MQHIVGKLSMSSFQRYKVYVNQSLDERVMAPGSRGVGAVFVHFSDEDSGQTGNAIGEPRVPRRSWSRYLSNAPGVADPLVASVDTGGKFSFIFLCFFIFLDTDPHLASVCVISISFPFRDRSCVCVCGNLCTCVHMSTNLESPPTMENFKV